MILHTCYPGLSGATDVCLNVALFISKKYMDSFICFFGREKIRNAYKIKIKKKIKYNLINYNFFIIGQLNFFFLLIKVKPKKIFLHNYNIIPVIFYKFFFFQKLRVISVIHTDINYIKKKFLNKFLVKIIFCFSNKIIFVNSIPSDFKNSIFKEKFSVIFNGVNTRKLKKNNYKKIKNKTIYMGMASRVDYGKRHDLLLKITSLLKKKNIKLKLLIAGDGKLLKFYKLQTKKLNLGNYISFLGDLNENNLIKFYKKLDFYIHLSDNEYKSISILQAMSFGLPILASKINNNYFIKAVSSSNYLVKNNDKEIYKLVLLLIKKNKINYNSKNRHYIVNNCNQKKMLEKYYMTL